MKKVLAICLTMVMVVSLSVNVLAAPDGFISSPSGNPAPGIVDFDTVCTGTPVVTPYGERDELPEDLRTAFENAYNEIVNTANLTLLSDELAQIAEDKGIDGENLKASDLFNIHVTDCDAHNEHNEFDITLSADTLDSFVGLLQMSGDGEWKLVADAQVVNGEHLKFTTDTLSPFAIIVDAKMAAPSGPETGDSFMVYVYAGVMAVSAIAMILLAVASKKQKHQ